ncbi:MAG: lysophospholipid acyltransferase family protein [Thalassolituus sp.]|uniref:lysophospholipid acyltransferase family protein n=1 Tax=Thalassolituus sp. TaxID=2030822 RepID=UPI0027D4B978|nr:lysophospholipid acyltransferase family protein [Thalassolituus sp.]MDQ4423866.1 lysophospholipid acyltransferase family protein [Thalassolituus sp.]MDQ4425535.1 lysophospholipid acyltransferase family protein [Thalassolituus sp.]
MPETTARSELLAACRTIIFMIWMTVLTLIWILPALIISPLMDLPARHRLIGRPFCIACVWSARLLLGLRWKVIYEGELPSRPSIIVAKHQSSWETFMLPALLPPQVQVIKKELTRIPIFGWYLAMMGPITIDRSQRTTALKELVKQGTKRLNNGFHVLIFPEGSRVPAGARKAFSKGGSMLASRVKAPVIPVAHNAGDFWPNHHWIRYPGTITVVIGAPLDSKDLPTKLLHQQCEEWINQRVDDISATPFDGTVITELTSGKRF